MRRASRCIATVIAAAAVLSTLGCKASDQGATRVAVVGTGLKLLDPTSSHLTAADELLIANVAQGLVRFDPRGQIEPGLAERWNVSDDGLSYIFRLGAAEWPDGGEVTAEQVARVLRKSIAAKGRNPLRDSLGAVVEVVAMTDRVLELRLAAPRPNLLQLLAQPELAIIRGGGGTGPFRIKQTAAARGEFRLTRDVAEPDGETMRTEEVRLVASNVEGGIRAFAAGNVDLLIGGTFADLPMVQSARVPRNSLQFDPVAGLFGLLPSDPKGPLNEPDVRRLLSEAIDRDALISSFNVPGLVPRATILQPGLEGIGAVPAPAWATVSLADRRAAQVAEADRLFGKESKPELTIALPDGPGADILFHRLAQDWGALGLKLNRVKLTQRADIQLVDATAPSTSPSWFLRQFRCEVTTICVSEADDLLDSARQAMIAPQRAAFFAEAARLMDEQQLFIPLTAPIRWSLVSSTVRGFAGNRFARHTLTGLRDTLERNATE